MEKRVAFTPRKKTGQALERMSRATGRPKSEIVNEMLDSMAEHMNNIATVAEQVRTMNVEALAEVRRAAVVAGSRVLPLAAEADAALMRLLDSVDAIRQPQDGDKPPSSNTGATLRSTPPRKVA